MKNGSLAGYVKAIGTLKTVQGTVLGNTNPPARGNLTKNPYGLTIIKKKLLDDAEHEYSGINTLNDNYTVDELRLIPRYQLNRNTVHHLRD